MRKQKKHLKVDKVWSAIEEQIQKKIRCLSGGLMAEVFTPPCQSG